MLSLYMLRLPTAAATYFCCYLPLPTILTAAASSCIFANVFKQLGQKPVTSERAFLRHHRPPLKDQVLAAAVLFCVLFAVRTDAFFYFTTRYIGGVDRDAGLYIWLTETNIKEFFRSAWFNTPAFYPYTRSLAWSDSFLLPSLAAAIFLKLGFSFLVAYNMVLLGANFLNGFFTYRLSYLLTGRSLPSAAAGGGFMAFSYLTSHLGHPQLQFAFWIPAALYCLFAYISEQRLRFGLLAGFLVALAFTCSVYYAVLIPPLMLCIAVSFLLLRPSYALLKSFSVFGLAFLIGISPLLLILPPYMDVRSTFGGRGLHEAFPFSASTLSYISAPVLNLLYGKTSFLSHPEAQLFPGLTVYALTALAFWRLRGARRLRAAAAGPLSAFLATLVCSALSAPAAISNFSPLAEHAGGMRAAAAAGAWISLAAFVWFLAKLGAAERRAGCSFMTNRGLIASLLFAACTFFLLSLGPLADPAGKETAFAPFAVFYRLVPGANGIRAVSRLGAAAVFCLFAAAPFALALLVQRWKRPVLICAAAASLMIVENLNTAIPVEGPTPVPEIFEMARELSAPGDAMIALPMARRLTPHGTVASWSDYALLNVSYMKWALPSGIPIVNGYSGQRSRIMLEFPGKTSHFPDKRSIDALSSIAGLRFIVYMPEYSTAFSAKAFLERIKSFSDSLTLRAIDPAGNYLLEFSPETRLSEGFFLRVPSYPQGILKLELLGLFHEEKTEATVQLFLKKHSEDKPFETLTIPLDGKRHSYSVSLPQTPDRVRPLLVSFKTDSGVMLGRSRFQADGIHH